MRRIHFKCCVAATIFSLLVLSGCAPFDSIRNISPASDLKNKTILIGKLECRNNEQQVPCIRGYRLFIKNKKINKEFALVNDRRGYIYAPLEPGEYQFTKFLRSGGSNRHDYFSFQPPLDFDVKQGEGAVNFGTFVFDLSVGWHRKELTMVQLSHYEEVEQYINLDFGDETTAAKLNFQTQLPADKLSPVKSEVPYAGPLGEIVAQFVLYLVSH